MFQQKEERTSTVTCWFYMKEKPAVISPLGHKNAEEL